MESTNPYSESPMSIRSLRSIVATQPPTTTARTATVYEAALLMKERGKGALLVLDGSKLVGIFTERDALFRVIAAGRDPATTAVGDVMTREPITVQVDASIEDVATLLVERDVSRLPVLEGDRLVGIVTKGDIVRSLVEE